jgi:hypothetical protein
MVGKKTRRENKRRKTKRKSRKSSFPAHPK